MGQGPVSVGTRLYPNEQALPFAHNQLSQIQSYSQRKQSRPKLHQRRNTAATWIEHILRIRIEAAAGRRGNLPQDEIVRAVVGHLLLFAIQSDLRKRARFSERPHAE